MLGVVRPSAHASAATAIVAANKVAERVAVDASAFAVELPVAEVEFCAFASAMTVTAFLALRRQARNLSLDWSRCEHLRASNTNIVRTSLLLLFCEIFEKCGFFVFFGIVHTTSGAFFGGGRSGRDCWKFPLPGGSHQYRRPPL